MPACFDMDCKDIGAGIFKFFSIFLRLFDHEVNVKYLIRCFSHEPDEHGAKADVGYKSPVHYVYVKPIGLTFVDHFAIIFQL
jgi:hypothetical protein